MFPMPCISKVVSSYALELFESFAKIYCLPYYIFNISILQVVQSLFIILLFVTVLLCRLQDEFVAPICSINYQRIEGLFLTSTIIRLARWLTQVSAHPCNR